MNTVIVEVEKKDEVDRWEEELIARFSKADLLNRNFKIIERQLEKGRVQIEYQYKPPYPLDCIRVDIK